MKREEEDEGEEEEDEEEAIESVERTQLAASGDRKQKQTLEECDVNQNKQIVSCRLMTENTYDH